MSVPEGAAEVLLDLEDFTPTVPDELTHYCLRRTGSDCHDLKLVRAVGLAAQRFIDIVVHDAISQCKLRGTLPVKALKEQGYNPRDRRLVLTSEDLAAVLQTHGVDARSAPYFADNKK